MDRQRPSIASQELPKARVSFYVFSDFSRNLFLTKLTKFQRILDKVPAESFLDENAVSRHVCTWLNCPKTGPMYQAVKQRYITVSILEFRLVFDSYLLTPPDFKILIILIIKYITSLLNGLVYIEHRSVTLRSIPRPISRVLCRRGALRRSF